MNYSDLHGISQNDQGPHQGQPVLTAGEPLQSAHAVMILVHGRGAGAEDMLGLAGSFEQPGLAFLAPQANQYSWYPNRFTAPLESNEPWLTSALEVIGGLVELVTSPGGWEIPLDRVYIAGFSQGACLVLEYAARNPNRFAGIFGLSGGLIGPDGVKRASAGDFAGTPVFLGCSDADPYIPARRVEATARFFKQRGAQVTTRFYPGLGHAVNEDETQTIGEIILTNA